MKPLYKSFIVLASLSSIFLCGCKNKKNEEVLPSVQEEIVLQQPEEENIVEAVVEEDGKEILSPLGDDFVFTSSNEAHKKYLDDPLDFHEYDLQGFSPDDEVALVCSEACLFYSLDQFEGQNWVSADRYLNIVDFDSLKGEAVPLGTLLSFDDKPYRNPSREEWYSKYYGYFYLWENYNYFYKTEWNGKEGFVFGADIELRGKAEKMAVYAESYRTEGVPSVFHSSTGINALSKDVVSMLEQNRLAFEETDSSYLDTDDLLQQYLGMQNDKTVPLFITTDLASHTQHLAFDKMLQKIEENHFAKELLSLTDNFINALEFREDVSEEVRTKAIEYFQVPQLILRSAPVKSIEDGWPHNVVYEEVDVDSFIDEYSDAVKSDYYKIMNAEGNSSSVFTFGSGEDAFSVVEDFTQYKPRGHYTKNGVLESYFRAQMWFGRIHFCIAKSGFNGMSDRETLAMAPIVMLIMDVVKDNPGLYDQWKELFDPFTRLIGVCDDLGFDEVLPLWKEQDASDFNAWTSDEGNIKYFVELCHEKLRSPVISGNTTIEGPEEGKSIDEAKPPMGWRFLGQRFTWDSYIHDMVSAPRLKTRSLVRGLDIMKVLGSNSAEYLLASRDYYDDNIGLEPYAGGKDLKERLDALQKEFVEKPMDFWTETYYNNVLAVIKSQADFESGAGFYFTESPMWSIKSLNSSLSTWAELRHDTLLYVKQSYAEKGGGDDLSPTYRTKKLPLPVNYIEPNLAFWKTSLASVEKLYDTVLMYELYDDEINLQLKNLENMYSRAIEICNKEINDLPVTEEENKWIRTIPSICEEIFMSNYSGYVEDKDGLKMACIADIFTNAEIGKVVEVGVGKPLKLYVPLNDGQGGKRIAVGFVPSYYEFYTSQSDRMTDEEWKEIVYDFNENLAGYQPFWMKGCVLPKQD